LYQNCESVFQFAGTISPLYGVLVLKAINTLQPPTARPVHEAFNFAGEFIERFIAASLPIRYKNSTLNKLAFPPSPSLPSYPRSSHNAA
jgi:hypothetical protein